MPRDGVFDPVRMRAVGSGPGEGRTQRVQHCAATDRNRRTAVERGAPALRGQALIYSRLTKDWIGFLSAAFRLVDLHDTTRCFGVAPGSVNESRTSRKDGVWLHPVVQLPAYLDECDLESNEGRWRPPLLRFDGKERAVRIRIRPRQRACALGWAVPGAGTGSGVGDGGVDYALVGRTAGKAPLIRAGDTGSSGCINTRNNGRALR